MTIDQEPVRKGRPTKDKTKDAQIIIRLDSDLLLQLDDIVQAEKDRTGYNITRSDFIRKAIINEIKNYSI